MASNRTNNIRSNNEETSGLSSEQDDDYYHEQQQQPPPPLPLVQNETDEDIVQVVYQSNQNGSLIGVESSLLTTAATTTSTSDAANSGNIIPCQLNNANNNYNDIIENASLIGPHRSTSFTLPAVEEESSYSSNNNNNNNNNSNSNSNSNNNNSSSGAGGDGRGRSGAGAAAPESYYMNQNDDKFSSTEMSSSQQESGKSKLNYHTDLQQASINEHENNVDNFNNFNIKNTSTIDYGQNSHIPISEFNTFDYQEQQNYNPEVIYSTINKKQNKNSTILQSQLEYENQQQQYTGYPISLNESNSSTTSFHTALSNQQQQQQQQNNQTPLESRELDPTANSDSANTSNGTLQNKQSPIKEEEQVEHYEEKKNLIDYSNTNENIEDININNNNKKVILNDYDYDNVNENENDDEKENNDDDFHKLLTRSKGGAAESGSFRNNFRKKLGVSVSTNENDLNAHRQKLLEVREATTRATIDNSDVIEEDSEEIRSLPKFKRTHSVSFNVGSNRSGRHSVDIRNLPSYLTVKRASIVDVAKGAMSSIMHSLGASSGGGSASNSHRRDSSPEDAFDEPIFEEPIAPTLSLGQRVALVRNSGAEFGTVGWIGQLPDVDDDWIVGVIFDNMIGNCDGEHNGVRYFYSRENYAMFVPLSSLTKTDNYIGRPETGTMLSRMSVSLKPGQLISIHRSSIRLQHCFLNAPHQRVGHDVRAVSNRLHCQCHNCGPCAHLTKQGRVAATPIFGTHHAPNKKNSLAHAAVEILAHHHHHYHEEEHHEEDYQFGDNAAHACNFVRYSCCQQSGIDGHDFSADCQMVRPEFLDNLIHAPRAPHRRSRPRKSRLNKTSQGLKQLKQNTENLTNQLADVGPNDQLDGAHFLTANPDYNQALTIKSTSSTAKSESSYSSCSSSRSSSPNDGRQSATAPTAAAAGGSGAGMYGINYNFDQMSGYQYNTYNQTTNNNAYSTVDSQMSVIDQQRFIFRKESSTIRSKQSNESDDYYNYQQGSGGFGSSIRRCLACLIGRKDRRGNEHKRRPKKRKLSARNRIIEYRRRQSTFVPSTLAKPQEDFASHGIIFPSNQAVQYNNTAIDSNSDYSSYSKSSSSSSRSQSPDNNIEAQTSNYQQNPPTEERHVMEDTYQYNGNDNNRLTMTLDHGIPQGFNEQQLKSCSNTIPNNNSLDLNYDNYTFSDSYSSSLKKASVREEFDLTDLGYYDSMGSNSNDTLKHIVDQEVNNEEPLNNVISNNNLDVNLELISPLLSLDGSNQDDVLEISSPTVSTLGCEESTELEDRDEDSNVCEKMNSLNIDDNEDNDG